MFSDLRAGRSSTTIEILPAGILGVEISHSVMFRIKDYVIGFEDLEPVCKSEPRKYQFTSHLHKVVRDVSIPPGIRFLIQDHIQKFEKNFYALALMKD
ncbi:hypothetical protein DY000_02023435 [Brassica cretica]|uniref:Uncharacterized protein n=1 Tax=Brassica cretica TaxID=69181 RepID=A0ABQ7DYU0_BRACR|nr:hypothetical protein DY000_02023435 [Brassica cretica]